MLDRYRANHELFIGDIPVGPQHPVFIIAEIGINHNGSLETAFRLVDAAVEAGASAVKLQKRSLPDLYSQDVLDDFSSQEQCLQYILPVLQSCELSDSDIAAVKSYAEKQGIVFLCTPFDIKSARFLRSLGVSAFKISSSDLTNMPLLEEIATYGLPLLVSTGMSLDQEIDYTVDYLRKRKAQFAIFHCVSAYPVDPRDARLRRIDYLSRRYNCPVGYSSHDVGSALSVTAVSLGACIIEKHITLDQSLDGPDHKLSLLPEELKRLVAGVRECELALTDRKEVLLQGELINRVVFRKALVAARAISPGERFTPEMVEVKGPGKGISPQRLPDLLGRTSHRRLETGDFFQESDIREREESESNYSFGWGRWGMVVRYHDFERALDFNPETLEFHLTYADTLAELPYEKLDQFRDRLKNCVLRVHCCEYIRDKLFDLTSMYDEVVTESFETLQRVMDVAHELSRYFSDEKPLVIFNVGAMSLQTDARPVEIDPQKLYSVLAQLRLHNCGLLAQNMPPYPWYFGGQWKGHYFLRSKELVDFAQATGQGICLDLSHAFMVSRFLDIPLGELVSDLRPFVKHIHVADARSLSGEGLAIGHGDIDFGEFFRIYREFDGTWIPEIWMGHLDDFRGFREAMKSLAPLMRTCD